MATGRRESIGTHPERGPSGAFGSPTGVPPVVSRTAEEQQRVTGAIGYPYP